VLDEPVAGNVLKPWRRRLGAGLLVEPCFGYATDGPSTPQVRSTSTVSASSLPNNTDALPRAVRTMPRPLERRLRKVCCRKDTKLSDRSGPLGDDPFSGRHRTSHERMTGLPWDASYHDGVPAWLAIIKTDLVEASGAFLPMDTA
jgi:hypothetical protein